ncbi:MAG TPA: methylenetetrahydrofolate reductase [Methylomusa anaerophila]|uniref:Methylenetetrahydrofolate reductase n=1 Tax=Methylomusa anaerophila TaxID=1930071 RepID=A0A348AK60_9FIRM|nr:methylenetetrahydrofolate reductase [Methylomusa anaerophila]BBB91458.1 bifunctional homocysteine S-methyltransferase/5,10-methylenetetrahydrofolate reductase [Methylomusa anaerophila]HML89952.1 methylenetetrahydrofolate reductase [Methylomusa anaerophila]
MLLKDKLGKSFVFTTELGGINGTDIEKSIAKVREYAGLDAINIHDCPNARLRMNSVMAAAVINRATGMETIPHFTCRDRSLLGTQADLLGAHALGIRYLLPTTGDNPQHGPYKSSGVYDYNSAELIALIKNFNAGQDANGQAFQGQTQFTVAATATPAAANLAAEIANMQKKVNADADFFQTQPVYDAAQAGVFLAQAKVFGKPVLLGLMPLKSLKMADFVNKNVAGVTVPPTILAAMEQGKTGFEVACELISQVYRQVDGLHIFGMGDVAVTNRLVAYTKELLSR